MKFYLTTLLIVVLLGSLFVPLISKGVEVRIRNPLKAESLTGLLDAIINFIFYLALAIAPIMIIVAGFYFITAAGDPEKIMTAKKLVLWVLIGLLIVFCAKGLIALFKEIFGVEEAVV
jgi:hypothetical protein